jgi:hypothetical protein
MVLIQLIIIIVINLAIGGTVGELDGRPNVSVDEYKQPFNGWLSDFSFWNRRLKCN